MKEKIVTSKESGSQGGKALFKKRGKKYMSKIGKKGAAAKWNKKSQTKKKK